MTELQTADFEMIHCPRCHTANSVADLNCRKCDAELSKAREFLIPMWAGVAAIGLVFIFILMVFANVLFDAGVYIAIPLILIGAVMAIAGNLWFLTVAFKQDVMWGLACIFIPFASFAFTFKYMDRAGKPIGLSVLGMAIIVVSGFLSTMI